MVQRYVALLRGLNVGGHRVKMERLRALFTDMGFQDVSTFIASGNVVFGAESGDADALREAIELHLRDALGYGVPTFLRTPEELAAIAAWEPGQDGSEESTKTSHHVIFLHRPADEALRAVLEGLNSDMDHFQVLGREVHWSIQGGMSDSPLFGGAFEKATRGVVMTVRNMNTLRRLVTKLSPP